MEKIAYIKIGLMIIVLWASYIAGAFQYDQRLLLTKFQRTLVSYIFMFVGGVCAGIVWII